MKAEILGKLKSYAALCLCPWGTKEALGSWSFHLLEKPGVTWAGGGELPRGSHPDASQTATAQQQEVPSKPFSLAFLVT